VAAWLTSALCHAPAVLATRFTEDMHFVSLQVYCNEIIASETRNYINYRDSLSELRHLHTRTATMAVQLPLLLVRTFGNIVFLRETVSLA